MSKPCVHIIGGGLAGSEAAWLLAEFGILVHLYEMRPERKTQAHQGQDLAELVCSNSFRSDDHTFNAIGVLHEEMRKINSLVMAAAALAKVPAGSALAVDRDIFAKKITQSLEEHPNIQIHRKHISNPNELLKSDKDKVIIAAGPLASDELLDWIKSLTPEDPPAFFDSIAPIVHFDSIDQDKTWFQSRYDKGEGKDYINCPMNKQQYEKFIQDLIEGDKTEFKEWEKDTPYFEGCLPIEVMAERGVETLRFGPLKPKGLTDPRSDEKSWAVVQLRQDNKLRTLWNIVGFQTKLKHGEQVRIFRSIPGLEKAEFARLGGIHRNSYINSPKLLNKNLSLKTDPRIFFAGQITGVEGYIESASCGIMAGLSALSDLKETSFLAPPPTTSMGGLLTHITGGAIADFKPMNANFGLIPEIQAKDARGRLLRGRDKKQAQAARALEDFGLWTKEIKKLFAKS